MPKKQTIFLVLFPTFLILGAILIASKSIGNQFSEIANSSYQLSSEVGSGLNNISSSLLQANQQPNNNTENYTDYNTENTQLNPDLILDFSLAAQYIGVFGEDLKAIIADSDSNIPYLKTKEGKYIFNKKSLDKWMEKSYEMK